MNDTTSGITQVATVAVHVADQDRSLKFYIDSLGFEIRRDVPFGDGNRWIEVAPPGGATSVAVLADPGGMAGVDTGIRLATTDADADHARLTALGADVASEVMRWPGVPAMFVLRDTDGNTLYIVES